MHENDKRALDSFLSKIEFSKYDTIYFQNHLQDGSCYKYYLKKDMIVKWFYIHGDEAPKELYVLARWIERLKDKLTLHPIDTAVDFGDLKYILLPPPPPPPTE